MLVVGLTNSSRRTFNAAFRRAHLPHFEKLRALAAAVPGVRLLETARYLCNDVDCSMTLGNDILYADPNHLNVLGSRYVGRRLIADYGTWLDPP